MHQSINQSAHNDVPSRYLFTHIHQEKKICMTDQPSNGRTTMRLNWTFWENSEDYLTSLKHTVGFPSHFRPIPNIFSHNRLIEKKRVTDRRTDGRADRPSYRDAWTHLKTDHQRTDVN